MEETCAPGYSYLLNDKKQSVGRYDLAGKWDPAGSGAGLDLDLRGGVAVIATTLGLRR
jgi:hypothetical protein